MQSDAHSNSKSSADAATARTRRLGVEKLELRSILAALTGLPEALDTLPASDSEFNYELQSQLGEFQLLGPSRLAQAGLMPARFEVSPTSDGATTHPIAVTITDPVNWTNLRPITVGSAQIIKSPPLDSMEFDPTWQFKTVDWPYLRESWIGRLQEIEREADQPVTDLPWDSDSSADNSDGSGPGKTSAGESSGGPPDSNSDSSSSAQPSADVSGPADDTPLFPWLKLGDLPGTLPWSLRHTSPHSADARRDSKSLGTALNRELHEGENSQLEIEHEDHQSTDDDDTTGLMLELRPARFTGIGGYATTNRPAVSTTSSSGTYGTLQLPFGSTPVPSAGFDRDLVSEFVPQSVFVEFDEGGLVELVAVTTLRSTTTGSTSDAAALHPGIIEAEIGLFQAIDVASSLVAEPSQAALSPFILVILFQLFDQRRKVEASESRESTMI